MCALAFYIEVKCTPLLVYCKTYKYRQMAVECAYHVIRRFVIPIIRQIQQPYHTNQPLELIRVTSMLKGI